VGLGIFRYSLSDAESSEFRYILTRNPADIDLYTKLMGQAKNQLTDLRDRIAGDPLQQKYLDQIEPLFKAKQDQVTQAFALEQAGNHAGALQVVSSDDSRQNMLQMEKIVEDMQTVASETLGVRQNIYSHNFKVASALSVASMALSLFCIVGILWLLRRLEQLQSAVTLDALREMISYEDGRLTIEEYLRRRAEALEAHGKAQIEAEKLLGQIERSRPRSATAPVRPPQGPIAVAEEENRPPRP